MSDSEDQNILNGCSESEEDENNNDVNEDEDKDNNDDVINNKMLTNKTKAYIKIDDQIKIKKEELKELNEQLKKLEKWVIEYCDNKKINELDIPNGKLIKNNIEVKAPLKPKIIEETILEKIKHDKIFDTDDKCNKATEDIMKGMEIKREITIKTNIKRQIGKGAKKITKRKKI